MSKANTKEVEMNTMHRSGSANRFQVNLVNHDERTGGGGQNGNANATTDDDTFPEELVKRRTSRLQSLRPSFRDKERKNSQTTRFKVDNNGSDSNDDEEDNLIDENKYARSFRHFTREALPRVDNYRNILSFQANNRPTLDELHHASITNKETMRRGTVQVDLGELEGSVKFGWIKGVLMRCLLNIWGVMLFLRLSWVVGQAGIVQGVVLVLITTVVTAITSLSMSAISTNGVIKGGGTYYMISRSLGPEFGGSIGLIFSLANAVACAMYVVGFCESMTDLLASFGLQIIDGDVQDIRIIGCITIVILLGIVVIGMEWEAKAQVVLLIILLVAIADFLIGTIIGPKSDDDLAKGFVGYNSTVFMENLGSDYRPVKNVNHDFFSVFAIFFPAATGILAGANISGDLKDPSTAIPKGTILAIILTSISYVGMAIMAGATVLRDATGNVTDTMNGSWAFTECAPEECQYGLHNSFQVMEMVSAFGPIIYAGCFAATLSSALASLVSAPKVFQALCKDKLYPKIGWFGKGFGKNNEPVRGYLLTFVISVAVILIGELNLIAPLISNFFLAAYCLVNFSTFHASLAKPVGWRPTFRFYNMWLSLLGAILCIAVMFLISWPTALITFAVVLALYLFVSYRKPDVNWGSTTQAQTYKNALLSVQQLNNVEDHVKNYRPQILVMSGHPSTRPLLVNFAYLLTKNLSLMVCGHVSKTQTSQKYRNYLQRKATDWFRRHKVKGFYAYVDDNDFETGARAAMQASGIGKLKPNVLLLGYKNDWSKCDSVELEQYFNVVHKALDMYLSVAILRVAKGLDYSPVLGEETSVKHIVEAPRSLVHNDSTNDLDGQNKISSLHGSCDSLSRNLSQAERNNVREKNEKNLKASSTSDLTVGTPRNQTVSGMPDPMDINAKLLNETNQRSLKRTHNDPALLYRGPGGVELPKDILDELSQFTSKKKNGIIDVWWLYDDGGLTLLLPYIISTRRNWSACKLRVFALANRRAELEFEQRNMASLLAKFRIDYSDLKLLPVVTKKPEQSTVSFFKGLIKDFTGDEPGQISEAELLAVQDKTNRHLNLREHLLEQSTKSDLVVMTLPMPRKGVVSAPLYMAWLETLSQGLPPFLFVRGNQTSVLTFYS
ncbi:bumetanide-sensitive sodium-(potassium)-chloride cotransporter isoform X1 [Wyeomyia smithii]|uniref:bumetanide-sensitive sodium-(potassium)-chloride cotransporter isoform X1 n=1 Tax=Wyeomyia smithii TaxID=174621 RepID=UPI00246804C4|nr:bumetanide-sensitive sodium-(potassium)-chloride cotransporter isoform X1 [Wyeomyia smithii]XP_055540550.1 bumetanide-sensitive sodium-(potassium)-chloride cotransporter isoform X1 [Wyeomyia smithii]XP_055540552.1 bumetanide-sensitive sodium-(potassium)-chloride cotransporter isoform X1 [Wyeomyia smithii]